VPVRAAGLRESALPERWVPADKLASTALPAPVKKLLLGLVEAGLQGGLFDDGAA
jgi:A/G-specific adenine glycosylase